MMEEGIFWSVLHVIDGCYLPVELVWLFDCVYALCYYFHALRLGRNTFLNKNCERVDMIYVFGMPNSKLFKNSGIEFLTPFP